MKIRKLVQLNESGQGLTEYLILLLLVSIVTIAAVKSLGGVIKSKLTVVKDHVNKDVTLED